ncbi:MAG: hypothetical protein ACRDGI_07740 [Candidatus Limnocylindrales bacterium]
MKNPLATVVRAEAQLTRLYARELGLTPSSMSDYPDLRPVPPDPMAALMISRVRGLQGHA